MALKRSDDYSDLRVSGILAWIHRLVMFITFPIRRFWQIISILAAAAVLLVVVHFYYGVGFEHVTRWYYSLVPNAELLHKKDQTIAALSAKLEQIKNSTVEAVAVPTEPVEEKEPEVQEDNTRHFVAWNVPKFKKAKYTPHSSQLKIAKPKIKEELQPEPEPKPEPKPEPEEIVIEPEPQIAIEIKPEPKVIEPKVATKFEPEEEPEENEEYDEPKEDEEPEVVAALEPESRMEIEIAPDIEIEIEEEPKVQTITKPKFEFPTIQRDPDQDDDGIGYRLSFASKKNDNKIVLEEPPAPPEPSIKFFGAMNNNSDNVSFNRGKLTDYYKIIKNRGLTYLSRPEVIYGSAEIVGPNSLFVNDKFMFLYGIYTDPREYDAKAAQKYLENITANLGVRCAIVAYAGQTNSATALCFTPKTFINGALVKRDLARNISLK